MRKGILHEELTGTPLKIVATDEEGTIIYLEQEEMVNTVIPLQEESDLFEI